jgi:preprotein translocase subunit SecY
MIRVRVSEAPNPPRRIPEIWRKAGLALAAATVLVLGGRIIAPGLNSQAIHDFLNGGHGAGLLRIYDWVVGGALSRGAVLALGIMPYLTARIWVRLGRAAIPAMSAMWTSASGRAKLTRWTRWLTGSLALLQSYNYVRFLEGIPGAVAHPGIGFLAKTTAVLTTGAIGVMLLSERFSERRDDDDAPATDDPATGTEPRHELPAGEAAAESAALSAETTERLLSAGQAPETELYKPRGERAGVRREADDASRRND